MNLPQREEILFRLKKMEKDDLTQLENQHLKVTETSRTFVRNIAMAFDLRLIRHQPGSKVFSMTV